MFFLQTIDLIITKDDLKFRDVSMSQLIHILKFFIIRLYLE